MGFVARIQLNREETDLSVLISDVVDLLSEQLKDSGSELKIDAPTMRGKWDRFRLEQILINLLTNAFRYGEGKLIEVKASLAGNTVTLLVRDHGKGIPTADFGRIFERFERAISSSEVSGLGLGLYIVRQIVNAHAGTIEVESQLGEGASFIVKLLLV